MESDQMRPLARRLLKCSIQRHVYRATSDEHAQRAELVANGLYADIYATWVEEVTKGGKLTDPVYRESVLALLRETLPEARSHVEEMFAYINLDGKVEIESFVEAFHPEAYLP